MSDYWSRTYLDDLDDEWRDMRDNPDPSDLTCPTPCYAHPDCGDADEPDRSHK